RSEGGEPVPFDGDYAGDFGGLGRDADPTDPGDWRGIAPVRDSTWHGTHTAGVIADVVPGAKIQPIRALSWRGGLLSDVAAGITWASGGTVDGTPANATPSRVINLSFSVQAACPNTLQTAIHDAVARGSVIVAAAGNNNDDATGYAPGNCANVITVGATNADGKRATYSNYGAAVDFAAPGATPRTTREGTSIAAAHTAAALALIAAQQPDLTPDQLAAELTGRYLRAFPGEACDDVTDKTCGAGLLQIASGPAQVDRVYFQEFSSSRWTGHEVCPSDARRRTNYGCVLLRETASYSTLFSANPDGTDQQAIDITCLPTQAHWKAPWNGVEKISVDAANGKIYWENDSEPGIARVNLDGSGCELVANGLYYGKRSIALDSTGSYLYSVQYTTLRRVDIGAGTITNLTLTDLGFTPSAIADLTVSGSTLYATVEGPSSSFSQVIAVSLDPTSTNQSATRVLSVDQPASMLGLSVDAANDRIYWATGSAVRRATLSTGADIETIATGTFDYVTLLPASGRLLAGDKDSAVGATLMDADGCNQEPSTIKTRSFPAAISSAAPTSPYVVTSTADTVDANDGVVTLREAITSANVGSGETITFDLPNPSTITLSSSLPQITKPMTITGPGEAQLTINANGSNQVFVINGGSGGLTGVTISDVTVTGATSTDTNNGAVVHNTKATSTLRRITVDSNSAARLIYNYNAGSYLTVDQSTFSGNSASGQRVIFGDHGSHDGSDNVVTVTDSVFANNDATALWAYRKMVVSDSTFTGNSTVGEIYRTGDQRFVDNTVTANGNGLFLKLYSGGTWEGSHTVTGNTFSGNNGYGLKLDANAVNAYSPNIRGTYVPPVITGNTFSGNSPDLIYGASRTVPAGIVATNTFVDPTPTPTPSPDSGSGGSSGSAGSGGSGAPVESRIPPPRVSLPVGVVVGSGVMVVDGVAVPVRPQRAPSGGSWSVKGADFSLDFIPQESQAGVLTGPQEELRAPAGGQVEVTGDGYLGGSSVSVYLLAPEAMGLASRSSDASVFLGDAVVGADGTFAVTFTVPALVDPGEFVLQINGWSQETSVRSVNLDLDVYAPMTSRSVAKGAFFQGRSAEFSRNGQRKLRTMISELPKVRQDVRVEITAVSVSLDDLESDLRLAARRGRELRDYLFESGVQGTYSVTVRTEDELRSEDKAPALIVSSKGKPLTTVRITYGAFSSSGN
ncbi:MAG: S8 family serine peptidase, partial [Candidatus Nanopelagicales bacterium]|nr:S8 family serine peptidase [Candidatus Nanopelagicales bacterium]